MGYEPKFKGNIGDVEIDVNHLIQIGFFIHKPYWCSEQD